MELFANSGVYLRIDMSCFTQRCRGLHRTFEMFTEGFGVHLRLFLSNRSIVLKSIEGPYDSNNCMKTTVPTMCPRIDDLVHNYR